MQKVTKYIMLAVLAVAGFVFGEELYAKKDQANQDQFIIVENMNVPEPTVWDKTKDVTSDVWDGTKDVASDVWDGTKDVASDVWDGTKQVGSDIKDGVTGDDKQKQNP